MNYETNEGLGQDKSNDRDLDRGYWWLKSKSELSSFNMSLHVTKNDNVQNDDVMQLWANIIRKSIMCATVPTTATAISSKSPSRGELFLKAIVQFAPDSRKKFEQFAYSVVLHDFTIMQRGAWLDVETLTKFKRFLPALRGFLGLYGDNGVAAGGFTQVMREARNAMTLKWKSL